MLLYTVQNFDTLENLFNYPFTYVQKQKTLGCKNLSDVQISYSDIGKMKYENTKLTIQPASTCSKLTIKTVEQGVKFVQS